MLCNLLYWLINSRMDALSYRGITNCSNPCYGGSVQDAAAPQDVWEEEGLLQVHAVQEGVDPLGRARTPVRARAEDSSRSRNESDRIMLNN